LRPNTAYLAFLTAGVAAIISGFMFSGFARIFIIVGGVALAVLLGGPVLASTVLRVPILTVDAAGVRFPLMGVRLGWADIMAVRQSITPARAALLIVPRDKEAALRQMRPWLRAEGRTNIASYGTPIVVSQHSIDHKLEDIQSAVAHFRPAS